MEKEQEPKTEQLSFTDSVLDGNLGALHTDRHGGKEAAGFALGLA